MTIRFLYLSGGVLLFTISVAIALQFSSLKPEAGWIDTGIAATTLLLALVVIAHARRQAVGTLRAHIRIASHWAAGTNGTGWTEDEIRPRERLMWSCPQISVIGQYSAASFAQVGLLGNLSLSPELAEPLAAVSQSLQAFNDAVAQCEAFKFGDNEMYRVIGEKLARAQMQVLGVEGNPPGEMDQQQLAAVMSAAELNEQQNLWCRTLLSLMRTVHVFYIGSPGSGGLHHHLAMLRAEVNRLYGLSG